MKKSTYSNASTQTTRDPAPPCAPTASSSGTKDTKATKLSELQESEYSKFFAAAIEQAERLPEESFQQHSARLADESVRWGHVRSAVDKISKTMLSHNPSEEKQINELQSKTHGAAQYMCAKSVQWAQDALSAAAVEGSQSGRGSEIWWRNYLSNTHGIMLGRLQETTSRSMDDPGEVSIADEMFANAKKVAMGIHETQARALGWDDNKIQSILKLENAAGSAGR